MGGDVSVSTNASLLHVNGLSGITTVPGDLRISRDDSLTNLSGLANLVEVTGELDVTANAALCQQHAETARAVTLEPATRVDVEWLKRGAAAGDAPSAYSLYLAGIDADKHLATAAASGQSRSWAQGGPPAPRQHRPPR